MKLHQGLKAARERESQETRLIDFVRAGWRYMDPAPFQWGWHIEAVCDHLQAVNSGEIRHLLINIPPRSSKSTITSVAWPAFTWAQPQSGPTTGPTTQFLFASYAQSLSLRDSVKCRRLLDSPWYQKNWGQRFNLTGDQNTKVRFENSTGGYRLATSVGGALTGEGAAIIVIDDPHNTVEMESQLERQGVISWWDEALSTRLNDPVNGAYVIIMQRLHEDDLSGHILTRNIGDWTHLCLPMRYEAGRHCTTSLLSPFTNLPWADPRSRDGELLAPARFPEREVRLLEATLGPFGAAGQLQQRPEPRGGGIFRRDWWKTWDLDDAVAYGAVTSHDAETLGDAALRFPDWGYRVASLDTAYGEKQENDWSALTIWQTWADKLGNPRIMMVYAWRGRLPLHEPALTAEERQQGVVREGLVEKVASFCDKWKVDRLLIESKANGMDVAREMRRLHQDKTWGINLIDPKGLDGVARAYAIQHLFSEGLVYAPASTDGTFRAWADAVISECASFPKAKHDDWVTTVCQALKHLRMCGFAPLAEERAAVEDAKLRRTPRPSRALYPV